MGTWSRKGEVGVLLPVAAKHSINLLVIPDYIFDQVLLSFLIDKGHQDTVAGLH